MAEGFCTLEDFRRALREASLPGDIAQEPQIAVDAIVAQTEPVEKTLRRHWYEPTGIAEASAVDIPTSTKTRDDEHDIPTHAGLVHGASEDRRLRRQSSDALLEAGQRDRRRQRIERPKEAIRIASGQPRALERPVDESIPAYTRITLERKDVDAVNELSVINESGGYDDWVGSSDFDGGVGKSHRGEDYWVRVNNGGVSELYLDVHAMDDDIASLSNAVYVDIDYGHEGIPRNVRRATAFLAASDFVEEAAVQIPDNARLYGSIQSKGEEMRAKAADLLDVYHLGEGDLEFRTDT